MTYDNNSNESSTQNHGPRGRWGYYGHSHDSFAWAKTPGPNPLKIATVVGGLLIFPPLGLLALGYFLWTNRRDAGGPQAAGYSRGMGRGCGGHGFRRGMRGSTGNHAFDAHRESVLRGLEEERQAFHEQRMEQRRKRDQEAYDAFRAAQAQKPESPEAQS